MKTTLWGGVSSRALCVPMTDAERRAGRFLRGPDHPTGTETKSVEELAAEVRAEFDKKFDEVKAIATDAIGKAERAEALTQEEKDRVDVTLTEANRLKARLDELEQKTAREPGPENRTPRTAGYAFIEDAEVKAFCANPTGGKRVGVEVKAIISGDVADNMGAAGDLVVPQRGALINAPTRRLTVRDLLTPGRTSSSSIQYPQETGFTNAAAPVAETGLVTKPQSDIKFDIKTSVVTTIAHWVLATRQIMDDAPMLQSYIDGRLRYGLGYAEELQLLHGDGTGVNLNGIYTQATDIGDMGKVALPTSLDVIRMAMLKAALALYPPTGVVLHPTDWAGMELTKDTQGRYVIGDPKSDLAGQVWGLPVVETPAMLVGKFLVGSKPAAQIFDREDARVELSTEDSDNFRKNLVTILAEERLALAVYAPLAFIKGDFAAAITALTT